MGAKVATQMLGPDGTKALAPSGAAVVGQEFQADPVALGQVATGLLDLLPVLQHTTAEYAYLPQTTRTNNAAVVAEGATKPTSVYAVTRIEQSLAVVAHLSEGIPRYWLLDNVALEMFVENELTFGLQVAVEAKVLTDVNATSGIQTQAYGTSVLTTLRKGLTNLETAGYAAGAIALHPSDWEGVELALSSINAIEHLSLPYDPASPSVVRCARRGHRLRPPAWVTPWPPTPSCSTPTPSASACSGRRRPTAMTSQRT